MLCSFFRLRGNDAVTTGLFEFQFEFAKTSLLKKVFWSDISSRELTNAASIILLGPKRDCTIRVGYADLCGQHSIDTTSCLLHWVSSPAIKTRQQAFVYIAQCLSWVSQQMHRLCTACASIGHKHVNALYHSGFEVLAITMVNTVACSQMVQTQTRMTASPECM